MPFIEVDSYGRHLDLGQGADHEFSFGRAEFELPLRYLSGHVEQAVG